MTILPLTITIGLCLAFAFLVFFLHGRARRPARAGARRCNCGADDGAAVVVSLGGRMPKKSSHGGCHGGHGETHERCPDCPSRHEGVC